MHFPESPAQVLGTSFSRILAFYFRNCRGYSFQPLPNLATCPGHRGSFKIHGFSEYTSEDSDPVGSAEPGNLQSVFLLSCARNPDT